MEKVFKKIIIGGVTGILLYICWYVLPPIKDSLVQKAEEKLKKHGLYKRYKVAYKILKAFLYVVIALMILIPLGFFIVVLSSSNK